MNEEIFNLILFCVPALLTGAIAYMFFKEHLVNDDKRRNFLIQKELQKEALPLRLQAYERMTLFLERISPANLLVRVKPISSEKESYESLLIANIEQEFEHNLAQQIYVSTECWSVITASKNATIQLIRKVALSEKINSADKLREAIVSEVMDKQPPSNAGLSFIKEEVRKIFGD